MSASVDLVEMFFPYVTSMQVVNAIPDDIELVLYTVFSIENFASGASCFPVFRKIFDRPGTRVFHLEGLHAKMLLVDGELISVGSQNLTARGAKNKEATVLEPEPVDANQRKNLEKWRSETVLLTCEMMEAMEALLPETRRIHREYRERLADAEETISKALETLTQERLERERLLELSRNRFDSVLSRVKDRLADLDGGIGRSKAERIVRNCTWVRNAYGHGPRRMRKIGDRLYWNNVLGWCWNSSGRNDTNKFSISMAYRSAGWYFEEFIRRERWSSLSLGDVRKHLKSRFHGHVYNLNDDAYHDYTLERDRDVIFWGYSFDLVDLVDVVIEEFQVENLYTAWQKLHKLEAADDA